MAEPGGPTEAAATLPDAGGLVRAASLETLGKLATVVGVLLPVTGAIYREVAFYYSGRTPMGIGTTLPVTQLALLGAWVLLPGLIGGLVFGWFLRKPSRIALPERPQLAKTWKGRIGQLVLLLVIGYFVVLPFASAAVRSITEERGAVGLVGWLVAGGVIVWATRTARRTDSVPWVRLLPVVLTIVVATAFGASAGPTTAGSFIAEIRFSADVGLEDGLYSVLGEDSDITWLLKCEDDATPIRIRSDQIVSETARRFGPSPTAPTLADMIATGRPGPGFIQRCPDPTSRSRAPIRVGVSRPLAYARSAPTLDAGNHA
jgi:hypothetical protein